MSEAPPTLDEIRTLINQLDEKIHERLKARAKLMPLVSAAKAAAATDDTPAPVFRAGREAEVLRRLVERHGDSNFPIAALVRIWREMICGMSRMQNEIRVAVHRPEKGDSRIWDLARDHFGAASTYLPMRRARDVVTAVRDGRAEVGVAPAPGAEDDEEPWWPGVAVTSPETPRIVEKLPILADANARSGAVVITLPGPEPETPEVHYLAIEAADGARRDRVAEALATAGVAAGPLLAAPGAAGVFLAETSAGWPGEIDDPAIRDVVPVGGYHAPIQAS